MPRRCGRGPPALSQSPTWPRRRPRWSGPAWEARRKLLYRLEGVELSFRRLPVLCGASLQHNPGEKLLLLGRNGSGKTTLLRVIAGELEPDSGDVEWASGFAAACVEQRLEAPPGTSGLDYCLSALPRLAQVERELEELGPRP